MNVDSISFLMVRSSVVWCVVDGAVVGNSSLASRADFRRKVEQWNVTSPSWAEAPAGTAAIRAAQLGAKVACVEQEPEAPAAPACGWAASRPRPGCRPRAMHQAGETFAKFGVEVSQPQLNFGQAVEWKNGVVKQMTGGVATLFKANGVEWVKGRGRFSGPNTLAVEGGEDIQFQSAIVATGSFPLRPPIEGIDSARCVDSTGLLAQTQVPRRLVVPGGGIIGCEFASIFQRFGSEVTIVEMLDTLIPQEDADAAERLSKAFGSAGSRSSSASSATASRTRVTSCACTSAATARASRPT